MTHSQILRSIRLWLSLFILGLIFSGVGSGQAGAYSFGTSRPGIIQQLSTRNVGEVISSDAY